ncbi:hypothetical protein [Thermoflavimicrobium dichotomicum]|uniref:Uncharacterized protein n=1 Tax=Thermoflavimicrobium dichotomicum TaxID=46223 RepID=A0A1I3K6L5_9BACL|nr:hypothetical protein [Thermoflavimicrobium dichotomicum]SFI68076.1 hypothetical protein SAMN05421852_101352 [Thermoflavimicrobium dichotomicum]
MNGRMIVVSGVILLCLFLSVMLNISQWRENAKLKEEISFYKEDEVVSKFVHSFIESFFAGDKKKILSSLTKEARQELESMEKEGPDPREETQIADKKIDIKKIFFDRVTGKEVNALVFVETDYQLNGHPIHEEYEMRVDLVKEGGEWKVKDYLTLR